jgi:hypothetical protein
MVNGNKSRNEIQGIRGLQDRLSFQVGNGGLVQAGQDYELKQELQELHVLSAICYFLT